MTSYENGHIIFDHAETVKAIKALIPAGEPFEVRVINGKYNMAGMFTNADTLTDALANINDHRASEANVYVTLNKFNPACYDRSHRDRFKVGASPTVSDDDITAYRWLLVDIDPVRTSGTSSTKEQLQGSRDTAKKILDYLTERGWPKPILATSGNGTHMLYRLDFPADEEHKQIVQRALQALDAAFSDSQQGVDVTVFNPARICKLYGTVARKGANTQERPHRMSQILRMPETVEVVPEEKVRELADLAPKLEPSPAQKKYRQAENDDFDFDAWLTKHNVPVRDRASYKGGTKYILEHCPFNPDHRHKDAACFQMADGTLGFKCFHASCADKGWKDFRLFFEPDAYSKAERQQAPAQQQEPELPPIEGLESRNFGGLRVVKASDLKGVVFQPMRYVIDELLTVGLTILAAPPKTGKSWLALDMCNCVSQGLPFWGYSTDKGNSLYLALEDSDRRIQERLWKIGSQFPDNFDYAVSGAKSISRGLIEQLEGWVQSVPDPRLIVIDVLARVKPSAERGRNAYEDDTQVYGLLQKFAVKHGIAMIGITHYSKLSRGMADPFERITGSMGAFGVADEAIAIFGDRGEEQTVKVTGRDILDKEFQSKFDEDSCTWRLIGSTEDVAKRRELEEYRRNGIVRAVLRLTEPTGEWSGKAKDLMEEAWRVEQDHTVGRVNEVGKVLFRFRRKLHELDGVDYCQDGGGRKGRGYHFQRINRRLV